MINHSETKESSEVVSYSTYCLAEDSLNTFSVVVMPLNVLLAP